MNDKDIPPSHIMQLSGHKHVQSINNYSHVSQEQQKSTSRILSGRLQCFKLKRTLLSKQQKKKVQRRQQQGYSRVLCFTEEILSSISARPLLQRKHKNNKLINE